MHGNDQPIAILYAHDIKEASANLGFFQKWVVVFVVFVGFVVFVVVIVVSLVMGSSR